MEEENFTLAEVEFLAEGYATYCTQDRDEDSTPAESYKSWHSWFTGQYPNWRESVSSTDKKEKKDA